MPGLSLSKDRAAGGVAANAEISSQVGVFRISAERAALVPLLPGQRPVAVMGQLQRWSAGVANLDDVAGLGEVHEPFGVGSVEI
jgi:NAD(P)H-flavin reductase